MDEEVEVDIKEICPNGEGLALIKGYSIFIKGVKPTDQHVKIRITRLDPVAADAQVVT